MATAMTKLTRGWNTCFFAFFLRVRGDRGAFLLDYSNMVDSLLLTNPAANRFCVLGLSGRYPNKSKKKKLYKKGVRRVQLFPTCIHTYTFKIHRVGSSVLVSTYCQWRQYTSNCNNIILCRFWFNCVWFMFYLQKVKNCLFSAVNIIVCYLCSNFKKLADHIFQSLNFRDLTKNECFRENHVYAS